MHSGRAQAGTWFTLQVSPGGYRREWSPEDWPLNTGGGMGPSTLSPRTLSIVLLVWPQSLMTVQKEHS